MHASNVCVSPAPVEHIPWTASLSLGFEYRPDKTVLAHRKRHGPLAVQRPFYPEDETCHVYILHPPGGVVGGDELDIDIKVDEHAHALVTTPGATKFYRSNGATARQRIQLKVNGTLEWLPQENIAFNGAQFVQETRIELTRDARFIGSEIHCFGRPANGESFQHGDARISLKLSREGKPLQIENTRVNPESGLNGPACLRAYPVTGIAYATPVTRDQLKLIRDSICESSPGDYFALTLIGDVLIARFLGANTRLAQKRFHLLWENLRPMVISRPACIPRIWNT